MARSKIKRIKGSGRFHLEHILNRFSIIVLRMNLGLETTAGLLFLRFLASFFSNFHKIKITKTPTFRLAAFDGDY